MTCSRLCPFIVIWLALMLNVPTEAQSTQQLFIDSPEPIESTLEPGEEVSSPKIMYQL